MTTEPQVDDQSEPEEPTLIVSASLYGPGVGTSTTAAMPATASPGQIADNLIAVVMGVSATLSPQVLEQTAMRVQNPDAPDMRTAPAPNLTVAQLDAWEATAREHQPSGPLAVSVPDHRGKKHQIPLDHVKAVLWACGAW